MGHLSRLDVRHKALPCGTVKVAAGPPIVCVVDDIGVAPPVSYTHLDVYKRQFLAIFDTEIFFLGLVLPFSLFIQRAHRQQDVGMGIVSRCV